MGISEWDFGTDYQLDLGIWLIEKSTGHVKKLEHYRAE